MFIPHEGPGTWQSFLKRKDNVGLTIMEARQKYLKEQLLFESYFQTLNTTSTVSTAAAGAAGGPAPSGGGGALKSYLVFFNSGEISAYPPFGDGALHEEVPGLTYNGASVFAFYFPPGGFRGSRNYFIIYDSAGKWNFRYQNPQSADSWETLSNAAITTIIDNSIDVYDIGSMTSPTDITNPVGTYTYDFGKGDQYISAVTPTGYTRAQAISEFGVN